MHNICINVIHVFCFHYYLLTFTDWTTLSKAFVKARHLESITLPMKSEVGESNVPYMVKPVLSALTKLPALKTFTMTRDPYFNEVRCVLLE